MTSRTKLLLLTALITLLEVVEIKTKQKEKEFALGPGPKSREPNYKKTKEPKNNIEIVLFLCWCILFEIQRAEFISVQ